ALHYQAAGKDVVALDDLQLTWQRALELRATGKNVIGAFNIEHLETVSGQAGALLDKEIHDTVPLAFLKAADEVIALDAPPDLIVRRMKGAAPGEDTLK